MAVDVSLLNSNSIDNIDTNFERVQTALQDAVSRSGITPNQMTADLDMNSNDLLNVASIDTEVLYINGEPVTPDTLGTIPANSVGSSQIIDGSVDTAELASDSITESKLNLTLQNKLIVNISDRTQLALVNPLEYTTAFLKETGREGLFEWNSGNLSSQVTIDTAQGTYIPPASDATGASGSWVRVRSSNTHHVKEYGDDVLVAVAVAGINGGVVEFDDGPYSISSYLDIPTNVSLRGNGRTRIDVSSITLANLNNLYAVVKDGDGLTDLGAFTNITARDEHITFTTTPNVEVGQIICIYNSANGSFLPPTDGFSGRDYYREGQRARIVEVDGNTIYLDQPIRLSYTSGGTVSIYKQDSTKGFIEGITFDATGYVTANNRVFRSRYGDRLRLINCNFIGGAYASCEIDQCYETEINLGTFETDIATASANSYPLSILNSAHTRAKGFTARGKWNGVGTGGNDIIGAIQSYDTVLEDFRASGIDAPGVDMHGNSELTHIVRGFIENGFSFGGKDTYYIDCTSTDKDYIYAGLWAEVWGGDHHYIGGKILINNANFGSNPSITAWGGAAFRAAQQDVNIKIHTHIEAPLADWIMGLRCDSATRKVNFDIDVTLRNVGSLTNFREVYKDTAPGLTADWDKLNVDGLPSGVPYTSYSGSQVYTAAKYDYPIQSGIATVTLSATTAINSAVVNFPHAYPITPTWDVKIPAYPNGNPTVIIPRTSYPTTTQISTTILSANGTNYPASGTLDTRWDVWL